MLPDPSLLDSKSWEEGVLPAMGPRLGIFSYDFKLYPSDRHDKYTPAGYYPSRPVLNNMEWQNIIDYYTSLSPDSLPSQVRPKIIRQDLSLFKVELPAYKYSSPAICFTKIDTAVSPHQLLLFDLAGNYLYRYNNQLQLTDSVRSGATICDIDFHNDTMVACNINVINPNNGKFGKAHYIHKNLNVDTLSLFDTLARPVQITSCDLNNDKKTDYLICQFGNLTGALSWEENTGNGKFIRHELVSQPGAIKAYVKDYNKDGLPDLWVLFAQGKEEIVLFTNKGNGQFDQRELLSFPSVYGSTYFELADFNKDGYPDIVYTCGDNADFSPVLKPYHGVYIYLNDGSNNFTQKYFFPINGCFKAIARDYDNDGDMDIAAISFFADYANQPEEGFIYLDNKGNFDFDPHTLPEIKLGRWLTMDAGDLDGDGRIDILLGNFSIRPTIIPSKIDWQKGPSFLVLKNISR